MVVLNQILHPSCSIWGSATINVGVQSSVSVSLDVLLTLMIITRLILVTRDVRKSMNTPFKFSGMYKGVITILCESSALYVISFLLWIGAWAIKSPSEYFFFPNLAQTQVRCLRAISARSRLTTVTNRSSLPSSSFCESLTGDHCRTSSFRGVSQRPRIKGNQRSLKRPLLVGILCDLRAWAE